jgi:hypothetical protein
VQCVVTDGEYKQMCQSRYDSIALLSQLGQHGNNHFTYTTLGAIKLQSLYLPKVVHLHSRYHSHFTFTIKEGGKQMGQSSYDGGRALHWASPHQAFSIGWREAGAGLLYSVEPSKGRSRPLSGKFVPLKKHYLESSFPNWIKSIFSP